MTVRALVLDFGGVITRTLFETHAASEQALGLAPGTLHWRGPFDPESDPLWGHMQAGHISERDYWLTRSRETGALLDEKWDTMADFVRRARGADPSVVIRPEAALTIDLAAQAGVRLAILSNELDLFYGSEIRERLPLLSQFEVIVDATYTAILKPDPRAYAAVCAALGLLASQCLFVDDQPRNVAGAEAAGMAAMLFDVTRPADSWRAVRQALLLEPACDDA